jgi:hypothetical protein
MYSDEENGVTEGLRSLYDQDAEGLKPSDQGRMAWQYSNIFGILGPEAIDELALLTPEDRAKHTRELWDKILDRQRLDLSGRRYQ